MIGIFDSGFGGLTVFKEIVKSLPSFDYFYLGDNARAPYGELSQAVIFEYTKQAVDYLFSQGCDLIILACNTTSAEALRKIQQEYLPKKYPGKNVLGVVRPLVEEAARLTKNKRIAVIGTVSTIESQAYFKELQAQDVSIKVIQQACPLLVPLVEESQENTPEAKEILEKYLVPVKKFQPDVLILGCTHYGFFTKQISQILDKDVIILDSGIVVAEKLVDYLQRHPEYNISANGQRTFLTTGSSDVFDQAATKFLGQPIKSQTIRLL